ncbi:hypothetical protein C8A05DRAFT_30798 [Staphylotrichum tortipilum]|uniref:AAA+ ATPase domain-containing protein n=1 Tax=Staphylotrichum tortipilum TaxID=2831512 RepID=A0AAN6MSX9_9PEZI|nr:hypothetical protein C8A05DRAFT_30798 [Staphylotrichum longicolle]
MPLIHLSRREMSEKAWKWRYKLQHFGDSGEKTLSDFSSSESGDSSLKKPDHTKKAPASGSPVVGGGRNGELGANASVKTLYEGPASREGMYDWVDYPPRQLSKSAAKAQDRVAIKVYKIKDLEKPIISGRFSLRYHMLEVQNPLLVAALAEFLKKQDVHLDTSESATFKHPFPELYFSYDDIVARHRTLDETEPAHPLKPFLLLLIRLLDEIFADTRARLRTLRADGLMSFKLAWTLFPRNTPLVSFGNNCEILSKVTEASTVTLNGRSMLVIRGNVLRFDGRGFSWEDYSVTINAFSGHRPVTELSAYPLEFHEDAAAVKARLTARGTKMLDFQALTYVNYSGIAIHSEGKNTSKHNVDGRIILDVVGYNRHHLAQGAREGSDPQSKKRQLVVGDGDDGAAHQGGTGSTTTNAAKTKRLSSAAQERNKQSMLAREAEDPLLMYMMPIVEGYALKNKLWMSFFIEDVAPMVYNDAAFDHLVYNEQQKDLVMSFVESHCGSGTATQKHPKAMEDVIAGKGQGLVILLSGPPGTGKTLMAEAVADRTRRPLFYLQAEDLGINAAALGANIKKVFEMATEWDAVILLDEADVFMAERHPQDIARNELVSIFLRELEYYRGIIFLTTNLYSTIDSAFRSRVSLHLLFNALTPEARMLIWRKFLDRLPPAPQAITKPLLLEEGEKPAPMAGKSEAGEAATARADVDEATPQITDEDIKELASWQLNGREIKTAVKLTKTWCDFKGYELSLSRLENGIKVTSPHASKTDHGQDTSLYDE